MLQIKINLFLKHLLKMAVILIGFKNHSDESLVVEAGQIKFSMTNNAHFPSPVPTLTELKDTTDEYSAALDNMGNGANATLLKNEKRKKLEDTLKRLGLYVETVADGNEVIAESSGFKLRNKPSPVGVLPKPANFKVIPAPAKGSVKLSIDKIHGAKTYLFEYKLNANATDDRWINILDSQSSLVISNLLSGQEYIFRVVGIGSNPTRVYSDEVSSFVL